MTWCQGPCPACTKKEGSNDYTCVTGGGSNQVTIGRDSETEWFVSCHYRDWADWVDVGDIPDSLEEILPLSLRLTSVGFIRYGQSTQF